MDQLRFDGQVAVITGSAGGIGYGIALACAKEGMKLVLADIDYEGVLKRKKEFEQMGINATALHVDVTKEDRILWMAEETLKAYGRADLLFNNAGITTFKDFDLMTDIDFKWHYNVMFMGCVYGIRAFLPIMQKQETGGRIITTASIGGLIYAPTMSAYIATKHALIGYIGTIQMEAEMRGFNVRFSVILPDRVVSKMAVYGSDRPEEYANKVEIQGETGAQFEESLHGLFDEVNDDINIEGYAISEVEAGRRIMDQIKIGNTYIFLSREELEMVQGVFDQMTGDYHRYWK